MGKHKGNQLHAEEGKYMGDSLYTNFLENSLTPQYLPRSYPIILHKAPSLISVYRVCMSVFMGKLTCVCAGGGQRLTSGAFFSHFSHFFVEQGLFLTLALIPWPGSLQDPPFSAFQC